MVIDHVFMLVEPDGPELAQLAALGLNGTYRRVHRGQGTANACFCFDNLFLELMWVDDPAAAGSEAIARTGLLERSLWRRNGACPFGVAWRGAPDPDVPTWGYAPPYLPPGVTVAVATDGDDPRQPMMFASPGALPPSAWPPEKRGALQRPAGLGAVTAIAIGLPADVAPSAALRAIAARAEPALTLEAGLPRLRLTAARIGGGPEVEIALPPGA